MSIVGRVCSAGNRRVTRIRRVLPQWRLGVARGSALVTCNGRALTAKELRHDLDSEAHTVFIEDQEAAA